ncbi:Protein CBG27105 [Caenorhabditis briggsae]|uniref:Protein CBG27105 n=1 Tax=Caenorhabditis briggsae TaxID=6238 RepID=B6IHI0_CAEBR|nr:Protein CBG27105 [Caenorhabditis briggsae]CAR99360.1 Protein CBG27105 [Caenorhabditis briggsae]
MAATWLNEVTESVDCHPEGEHSWKKKGKFEITWPTKIVYIEKRAFEKKNDVDLVMAESKEVRGIKLNEKHEADIGTENSQDGQCLLKTCYPRKDKLVSYMGWKDWNTLLPFIKKFTPPRRANKRIMSTKKN